MWRSTGRPGYQHVAMPYDQQDIIIRALREDDLAAALAIQVASYPSFLLEDHDAFASRLNVPTSCCLAAVRQGTLVAYLLAHGWVADSPPSVGTILDGRTAKSDVLFIHDLAVSSAGRNAGLGRKLLDRAFALAARDGLRCAQLIAVEGAATYWNRLGFAETRCSPSLLAKVAVYGPDARWMTRSIATIGGTAGFPEPHNEEI
jgi:ribosomal protein S18 acetylase RimI-like enzyme